jgi:hypothetical protein
MTDSELAVALTEAWTSDRPHVERVVLAAAIIATALERAGMRATLVGGAAIEFHAPDAYVTADLDFVVEGRDRAAIGEVLKALGMRAEGRHWVQGDLYVEVPGSYLSEPVDTVEIGALSLRVIRKEYVLGDRIIGYRWWKYAGYALQAIDMLAALASELDEAALRAHLRKEGAEDTYDLLLGFIASGIQPTTASLDALWQQHYR